MVSPARTARYVFVALTVTLSVAVTSSCAQESGNNTDVVQQGYQSGDGSITTWSPQERREPVTLTGTDYAGEPVDTSAQQGGIIVLNTWYAACPPCRAEADDLLQVATDRADDGVTLLGINRHDDAGTAQAFEREHSVTWPSINDADGAATATLSGVVPVKAVPTTVILDREGRVAARVLGEVDASTLNGLIDDVLDESA